MRFAVFLRSIQRIQYKTREIGRRIAVNLGTCHHFYILSLEDKVVKHCHLTIFKVSGGWVASVYHFIHYLHSKKGSKITILAN